MSAKGGKERGQLCPSKKRELNNNWHCPVVIIMMVGAGGILHLERHKTIFRYLTIMMRDKTYESALPKPGGVTQHNKRKRQIRFRK